MIFEPPVSGGNTPEPDPRTVNQRDPKARKPIWGLGEPGHDPDSLAVLSLQPSVRFSGFPSGKRPYPVHLGYLSHCGIVEEVSWRVTVGLDG